MMWNGVGARKDGYWRLIFTGYFHRGEYSPGHSLSERLNHILEFHKASVWRCWRSEFDVGGADEVVKIYQAF